MRPRLRALSTRIFPPGVRVVSRYALAWLLGVILVTGSTRPMESGDDLATVLDRLSRASRLYLDTALRFACDETITESGYKQRIHKFNYIYIYDQKKGFLDYRTLSARAEAKPVDPASLGLRFLERSFFWVLIFHKTRQPLHHYQLEGREQVSGREALKVSFEPIKPYKEKLNRWVGTAWVDPDSFQLLRVEAKPVEDHAAYLQMQKDRLDASHGRPIPLSRWVQLIENVSTDFSVEKNGMRFPGRTEITLTQYTVPFNRQLLKKDTQVVDRTMQKYSSYQFFNVRTESEVRSILTDTQAFPPPP